MPGIVFGAFGFAIMVFFGLRASLRIGYSNEAFGADRGTILHQCTSGDVTGDMHRVVGYISAAFTASKEA